MGHTVDEVIGTSVTDYLPPFEQDNIRRILELGFRSEQTERYETVEVRDDATKVVRSVGVAPVKHAGQITAAVFTAADSTEYSRGGTGYIASGALIPIRPSRRANNPLAAR
jgi:PAS domain S-box-containing protein